MKHLTRIFALLGISLISLFVARPVLAFPPLPSSFYGTVKVNEANVPDGTLIQASINGKVYAEGHTQTYQGDSVYSLDIPGDDASTTAVEGGKVDDPIVFTIEGVVTGLTGIWKSGTNVKLNLSVSTLTSVYTPTPTIVQTANLAAAQQATSQPTVQTISTSAIGALTKTSVPPVDLKQLTPTIPSPSPKSSPALSSPLVQPTSTVSPSPLQSNSSRTPQSIQPTRLILAATNSGNGSIDPGKISVVIGIISASILSTIFIFWLIFGHKPKK